MDSFQMVATHSEQVLDYSVDNQEPLDLTCRSELLASAAPVGGSVDGEPRLGCSRIDQFGGSLKGILHDGPLDSCGACRLRVARAGSLDASAS